jgi:hypothetical protein
VSIDFKNDKASVIADRIMQKATDSWWFWIVAAVFSVGQIALFFKRIIGLSTYKSTCGILSSDVAILIPQISVKILLVGVWFVIDIVVFAILCLFSIFAFISLVKGAIAIAAMFDKNAEKPVKPKKDNTTFLKITAKPNGNNRRLLAYWFKSFVSNHFSTVATTVFVVACIALNAKIYKACTECLVNKNQIFSIMFASVFSVIVFICVPVFVAWNTFKVGQKISSLVNDWYRDFVAVHGRPICDDRAASADLKEAEINTSYEVINYGNFSNYEFHMPLIYALTLKNENDRFAATSLRATLKNNTLYICFCDVTYNLSGSYVIAKDAHEMREYVSKTYAVKVNAGMSELDFDNIAKSALKLVAHRYYELVDQSKLEAVFEKRAAELSVETKEEIQEEIVENLSIAQNIENARHELSSRLSTLEDLIADSYQIVESDTAKDQEEYDDLFECKSKLEEAITAVDVFKQLVSEQISRFNQVIDLNKEKFNKEASDEAA